MQRAHPNLNLDWEQLAAFCRKWGIVEFALFGSLARGDFRTDSDMDVMVRFAPDARRDLFDIVHMKEELAALTGRAVDLTEKGRIENPFRRRSIERDLTIIYAA